MRRHLANAFYGLADYASYPLLMLLAAPVILRRLGASEYGLWIIATAVVSTGGIIVSGFCDANIRHVASLRSSNDLTSMVRCVRSTLFINLTLGFVLAVVVVVGAPHVASHFARSSSTTPAECMRALRIAGVLILARAIESAAVSTQRAFESYRQPVLIAICVRVLTLGSAVVLAMCGVHTVGLLLMTGAFLFAGCWMQLKQLLFFFGPVPLWPRLYHQELLMLLGLGVFVWVQAIGGVIFGYLDRILLGFSLGAKTVTPYVLCIQFAQPVFGITASGLHFLFPHLSSRVGAMSSVALRNVVAKAFALNLATVGIMAAGLLLFGYNFIRVWAGAALADKTRGVLQPVVFGAALTGLSVTGIYTLQALGRFRTVSFILLGSRASMSLLMWVLLQHEGLRGLLTVRVLYGAATLLVYLPLIPRLRSGARNAAACSAQIVPIEISGGSQA